MISGRICCVGLTENLIKAVKVVRKKPGKGTEEDSEGVYGFSSSVHKVRLPVNIVHPIQLLVGVGVGGTQRVKQS